MTTPSTLVTVEEYLQTTYRPDCDYVEGEIQERSMGQKDHGKLQGALLIWFWERRVTLGLFALPEQRIRIASDRVRVPDVCVLQPPEPDEQIFTEPPYIAIEILSPDDSFRRLQQRFDDFLSMGIPNIWVFDTAGRGWHIAADGHLEARNGVLQTRDGAVRLPIADLFAT